MRSVRDKLGKKQAWLVTLGLVFALAIGATASIAQAHKRAHASATLTPVTFVGVRGADNAPLVLGKKLGFFRQEGIDLQINFDIPPPQFATNLLTNKVQFASLAWGGLLPAAANGAPLVAILPMSDSGAAKTRTSKERPDEGQFVTLASSSIKKPADLKGKTIAVPILGGLPEIAIRNFARRYGVDQRDIKLAQINYPDMGAALRSGRVDVAALIGPFIAQLASQTKIRYLTSSSEAIIGRPGLTGLVAITSRSYLASNKATVDAFRRALRKSLVYAETHPKQLLAALPGILGIDAKLVKRMIPSSFDDKVDFKALSRYVTIAYNFGKLSKKIDPRTIAVLK